MSLNVQTTAVLYVYSTYSTHRYLYLYLYLYEYVFVGTITLFRVWLMQAPTSN